MFKSGPAFCSCSNADLMERLLSYFEMICPSVVESSSSSSAGPSSANTDVLEGPTTAPSQPVQPPSSSVEVPVRRQTHKGRYMWSLQWMMNVMCARSHLCKHCVSTLPQIHCVNFAAKITNGFQPLFQVKGTFVRLKFPVSATTPLPGSVLEFWDTLQSTMPMLGEYNMYMTDLTSKHS